jgi:peptide/nickel transport system ATP-binding protein/oligopeptide transport system ATP-binding protein
MNAQSAPAIKPIIAAEGLTRVFASNAGLQALRERKEVRAVDDVSLTILPGETLAVVGESGCGKSTLGRLLLRLIEPTSGRMLYDGMDYSRLSGGALHEVRSHIQMVFQDPYGSLSPRRTAGQIIAEPLEAYGVVKSAAGRRERVIELLRRVGLRPEHADRYPAQFSGGQRQRIGIARAIAVEPRVIVADEPVSALDVSVQAQVINLFQDLQRERGIAYLFVAHDLAVVRHIADRVAVMYLGRVVETGPKKGVYGAPQHPYTHALLSAVPQPDPRAHRRRIVLEGDLPSPTRIPSGCAFRTRCPLAQQICSEERPALREVAPGQLAACHFARPLPLTSVDAAAV